MKYLVVLIVVVLVLWLMLGRRPRAGARRRSEPGAAGAPEGMLACAHCGVYLPRGEALLGDGLAYCSAAHREAGPRG